MAERIPGGRAAGMNWWQFNPIALARGIRVELEHTPDWRVAREIAMDHLVEDPDYYTKLATVHLDGRFTPLRTYGGIAVVGLLLGAWLGGTSKGQTLVRRIRRK